MYVKGLPHGFSKYEVMELFGCYGQIQDVLIVDELHLNYSDAPYAAAFIFGDIS